MKENKDTSNTCHTCQYCKEAFSCNDICIGICPKCGDKYCYSCYPCITQHGGFCETCYAKWEIEGKDISEVVSQGFWHEVKDLSEEKPIVLEHGEDYTEGELYKCQCKCGEELHFDFCNDNASARCEKCRTEYDGIISSYTILIQPPEEK